MKPYAPYKKKAGDRSRPPYILFYRKKDLLFLLAPKILARTDSLRAIAETTVRRIGTIYYVCRKCIADRIFT